MKITKQIRVRFYYHSPDTMHNKEIYEKLASSIYLSWKALNTAYNEYIFQHINRQRRGDEYTDEEGRKFRNSGYIAIKDIDLPSNIRACISQTAFKRFKNDVKSGGVLSGRRTWSNFRYPSPMPFTKQGTEIKKNDEYFVKIPFLSQSHPFVLMVERNEQKLILDRIIDGTYKLNNPTLQWNKDRNKWYFNFSFSFEKNIDEDQLDEKIVVGVDLGISVPVACALNNDNYKRAFIGHRAEIDAFRSRIKSKRVQILRENKKIYGLRTGHGKSGKLKPIHKLENRISDFMNTYNHKLSRAIVNFAKDNHAGVINFEDLESLSDKKQQDYYLREWNIHDIITKTEYKASEEGIKVCKIKPQYTSQRCSKCGYIDPENRPKTPSQDKFLCQSCHYETHADFNAARNISLLTADSFFSIEK